MKQIDDPEIQLERRIIEYQIAITNSLMVAADEVYKKICELYKPEKYIGIWQQQYLYLYESQEDFAQEYYRIFIQSLKKWKPKEERGKSRYNGAGTFKNYFWGSLSNNYINVIKSVEGAAKRNVTLRCPECGVWVNPLSTHIIKAHAEILWKRLKKSKVDIDNIEQCPFCKSSIYRGKTVMTENELIKKHILSKHLHLLFEAFSEVHPSFQSGSIKYVSADMKSDSNDESFTIYDVTPGKSSILDQIINSGLTPIQQAIVENIVAKPNAFQLKYSKSMYRCSEDEFNRAVEGLQDKMTLMEDCIGKY